MSLFKAKKATPSHRLKKSKFNPGTVFLLVLLVVVVSASPIVLMLIVRGLPAMRSGRSSAWRSTG